MQSDENFTEKLQAYILDAPDILVVCKILIKQGDRYCSPGAKPSIAKGLWLSRLLTWSEFSSANSGDFMRTVIDGHTWLSLSSVEIHVWVRQPGDSDINLDCLDGDRYTVGVRRLVSYVYVQHTDSHQTLFPTIDVDNVNGAFQCGLQLIKEAALHEMKAGDVEERVLDDVEGWSPPPCLLDVEQLGMELEKAALDTAYE